MCSAVHDTYKYKLISGLWNINQHFILPTRLISLVWHFQMEIPETDRLKPQLSGWLGSTVDKGVIKIFIIWVNSFFKVTMRSTESELWLFSLATVWSTRWTEMVSVVPPASSFYSTNNIWLYQTRAVGSAAFDSAHVDPRKLTREKFRSVLLPLCLSQRCSFRSRD